MKKRLLALLFVVFCAALVPTAKDASAAGVGFPELAGKEVGVQTGTVFAEVLSTHAPTAKPVYLNSYPDMLVALQQGKIDAYIADEPVARLHVQEHPEFGIASRLQDDQYAFAVRLDDVKFAKEADAVIAALKASGELAKMEAKWFGNDDSVKIMPSFEAPPSAAVLRFGTEPYTKPFSYMLNNQVSGYDVELAMRIAHAMGRRFELYSMDFSGLLPSLISGKIDMVGVCLTVTAERAKAVRFLTSNYSGGIVSVAKTPVAGSFTQTEKTNHENKGFWARQLRSLQRTLIEEDRWKLILEGVQVTILISLAALALGTALGAGVCAMRCSARALPRRVAILFIHALQGTPVVVLLMIFYYIIFGSIDVPAMLVAIIAFSCNFAAYTAEMFRAGIQAIDKGQIEAATALGLSPWQTFIKITLPQAARHVLPVFKGEFISMVKMTSVVGYIAIQDLTKMSDIIRSATYEAFFPLIITALIYFGIAWIFIALLNLVEIRIDPKRRKRQVPGVCLPEGLVQ